MNNKKNRSKIFDKKESKRDQHWNNTQDKKLKITINKQLASVNERIDIKISFDDGKVNIITEMRPDPKSVDQELYRIPALQEFVPGFKYEVYSEGYHSDSIEDFAGWYCYSYNQGTCSRDISDIFNELRNGNIRVRL